MGCLHQHICDQGHNNDVPDVIRYYSTVMDDLVPLRLPGIQAPPRVQFRVQKTAPIDGLASDMVLDGSAEGMLRKKTCPPVAVAFAPF